MLYTVYVQDIQFGYKTALLITNNQELAENTVKVVNDMINTSYMQASLSSKVDDDKITYWFDDDFKCFFIKAICDNLKRTGVDPFPA